MSEQNVMLFLNKANTDALLQAKIKALTSNNLKDLIALAIREGLPFRAAEWEAVKATSFADEGELDERALDEVDGGAISTGSPTGFARTSTPLTSQTLFRKFSN